MMVKTAGILEALGIGADRQWDNFFASLSRRVKDPLQSDASKDIVWRASTDDGRTFIAALAADKNVPLNNRLRYFRAFDFNTGPENQNSLLKMIER